MDEDIQWIKISIVDEDIWYKLESNHVSWSLMNTGTIKEVAYMEWHQDGKSSAWMATSTCSTMWIDVSRLNIVVHHIIIGHWCIPLIDMRYPTNNDNQNHGTECKQTNVNWCVEVKHLKESIDQGTLMYSQNYRWRENIPLMTVSLKALKWL